VLLFLLPNF